MFVFVFFRPPPSRNLGLRRWRRTRKTRRNMPTKAFAYRRASVGRMKIVLPASSAHTDAYPGTDGTPVAEAKSFASGGDTVGVFERKMIYDVSVSSLNMMYAIYIYIYIYRYGCVSFESTAVYYYRRGRQAGGKLSVGRGGGSPGLPDGIAGPRVYNRGKRV